MFQSPFSNIIEAEKSHRYCKLHLQTWVYIHSAVSMLVAMLGIACGIVLLLYIDWHSHFLLYKQVLTYLRRNDPKLYWLSYRIAASIWIFIHFIHLVTIILTFTGIQLTKIYLIIPQIVVLILQMGAYILITFSLVLISATGARVTWMALTIVAFFLTFTLSNLVILVMFHKFLDDKRRALRQLLANNRTVHFKENR